MTPRAAPFQNIHNIFQCHGLEEELVRGIVIRGDGLRVVVDDVSLDALLAESHHGMNGAIIELDTLTDADRSRSQDQDLLSVRGLELAFCVIGGVVVRRLGLELGGTGVHHLVGGDDSQGDAQVCYLLPGLAG